jgi:hypothetical protein
MANQPVSPFYVPRPADDTYYSGAPTESPIIGFLTAQTMFGAAGQVPTKQWHYDYDEVPFFQWRPPLQSEIALFLTIGGRPKFNEWAWKYTDDDRAIWRQPPQGIVILPSSRGPGPTTRNFPWGLTYTIDDHPVWFQQVRQIGPQFTPPAPAVVPALAFASEQSAYSAAGSDSPSGQNWSGAGYMAKYEIDTIIQINGEFINSITGVYVDPSLVTLYLLTPAGVASSVDYPGAISRSSQGHYFYQITASISGSWTYKWQATGTAVATSPDTSFTVNASLLIAG